MTWSISPWALQEAILLKVAMRGKAFVEDGGRSHLETWLHFQGSHRNINTKFCDFSITLRMISWPRKLRTGENSFRQYSVLQNVSKVYSLIYQPVSWKSWNGNIKFLHFSMTRTRCPEFHSCSRPQIGTSNSITFTRVPHQDWYCTPKFELVKSCQMN